MLFIRDVYRAKQGKGYYEWRCETGHAARYAYTKNVPQSYTVQSYRPNYNRHGKGSYRWQCSGTFHRRADALNEVHWLRRCGYLTQLHNNTSGYYERVE